MSLCTSSVTMNFKSTTPILRIFDVSKAKGFYLEFLGFKVDWEHRFGESFPLYLQISRDNCVLHLSEHYGDACPGSSNRIEVSGLDEYWQFLTAQDDTFCKPGIEEVPWNERQIRVTDPFGNRITFYEPK